MSVDAFEKVKTEPVPTQSWIKSPAYLRLSHEKKIDSLLIIIQRIEVEHKKAIECVLNTQRDVACTCCDWTFKDANPYNLFYQTIKHFVKHKKAWQKEQLREREREKNEQKNKLQELYNKIPFTVFQIGETYEITDLGSKKSWIELLKMFEELLK